MRTCAILNAVWSLIHLYLSLCVWIFLFIFRPSPRGFSLKMSFTRKTHLHASINQSAVWVDSKRNFIRGLKMMLLKYFTRNTLLAYLYSNVNYYFWSDLSASALLSKLYLKIKPLWRERERETGKTEDKKISEKQIWEENESGDLVLDSNRVCPKNKAYHFELTKMSYAIKLIFWKLHRLLFHLVSSEIGSMLTRAQNQIECWWLPGNC